MVKFPAPHFMTKTPLFMRTNLKSIILQNNQRTNCELVKWIVTNNNLFINF